MTDFRFNFSGAESEVEHKDDEEISWLASEEVKPDKQIKEVDEINLLYLALLPCHETVIRHIMPTKIIAELKNKELQNVLNTAEKEHSDLVTGKYEGGLKIWECTYDLLQYLMHNKDIIEFQDKNVLDLGCGAGILGIYALQNGANVTFQDYNKEVLENVTIPNVLVNIEEKFREKEIKRCKFYSGDWTHFNNFLPNNEQFDIILSSETIYNESNYVKIITLFKNRLNNDGSVFLAAKSVYFGVGGGTKQFENTLEKYGSLKSNVCWKTETPILRQILKITK